MIVHKAPRVRTLSTLSTAAPLLASVRPMSTYFCESFGLMPEISSMEQEQGFSSRVLRCESFDYRSCATHRFQKRTFDFPRSERRRQPDHTRRWLQWRWRWRTHCTRTRTEKRVTTDYPSASRPTGIRSPGGFNKAGIKLRPKPSPQALMPCAYLELLPRRQKNIFCHY